MKRKGRYYDEKELAIAYHDKKFNCAQAVACAFAKEVGADEKLFSVQPKA